MTENDPSPTLDPQARAFLDRLASAALPTGDRLTVSQARAQMDVSTQFLGRPPRVAKVEDLKIPGPGGEIPVRVVTPIDPGEGMLPIVVFYHGGGWVLGNLASHEGLCRALANASGAIVVSVGYRLAPEHPFPAAAEDAFAAFAWFAENASRVGGDPSRVVVCGDSAGGNLAAVAALMARDRGGHAPLFQVLAYPVLEFDPDNASYRRFAAGFYLTRSEMLWFWDQYVPDVAERKNPYASPLAAPNLRGVAPAMVLWAGCDVLRDEAERYAARLREDEVSVVAVEYPGMIHGFLRRYPFFDEGKRALNDVATELRRRFGVTGASRGVDGAG